MRKILFYGAVLIGLEIVAAKTTGWGTLLTKGGSAIAGDVRAVEGR